MKPFLKLFTAVALVIVLFSLGSCSKDSDPTPSDIIVGTWTFSTVNATITVGTQSLVAYFKSQGLSDADAQTYADQITNSYKGDISGTLEVKKGGAYSATDAQGTTTTGKWELTSDGKTLTFDKGTADQAIFKVKTLTSTNMSITNDMTDTDSGLSLNVSLQIDLTKK